jgi:hypothetical protein
MTEPSRLCVEKICLLKESISEFRQLQISEQAEMECKRGGSNGSMAGFEFRANVKSGVWAA